MPTRQGRQIAEHTRANATITTLPFSVCSRSLGRNSICPNGKWSAVEVSATEAHLQLRRASAREDSAVAAAASQQRVCTVRVASGVGAPNGSRSALWERQCLRRSSPANRSIAQQQVCALSLSFRPTKRRGITL